MLAAEMAGRVRAAGEEKLESRPEPENALVQPPF
jgi:hypothetical protein